jgi:hypothetical protein
MGGGGGNRYGEPESEHTFFSYALSVAPFERNKILLRV